MISPYRLNSIYTINIEFNIRSSILKVFEKSNPIINFSRF